jgi:hypothetical protein
MFINTIKDELFMIFVSLGNYNVLSNPRHQFICRIRDLRRGPTS